MFVCMYGYTNGKGLRWFELKTYNAVKDAIIINYKLHSYYMLNHKKFCLIFFC